MYWVYVLKSKSFSKTYVGFTNDLERRLEQHNSGRSLYTKKYIPWDVVHKEEYAIQTDALRREKFLKSKSGRKFLKDLLAEN